MIISFLHTIYDEIDFFFKYIQISRERNFWDWPICFVPDFVIRIVSKIYFVLVFEVRTTTCDKYIIKFE